MPAGTHCEGRFEELVRSTHGLTAEASAVYEAVLRAMVPGSLAALASRVEVFAKSPERLDPLSIGLRERERILDLKKLGLASAYPMVGRGDACDLATTAAVSAREITVGAKSLVLRIYLAPLEWSGPEDVVVEAGVGATSHLEQHAVWRLARTDGTWSVQRCEFLWRALAADSRSKPRHWGS